MLPFLLRRLAWAGLVVFAAVSLVFILTRAVGDPAVATLGPQASASQLETFRAKHGLDRPIAEQYVRYLGSVVRGDLGSSFQTGEAVSDILATRIPRSLLLGGLTLVFEIVLGLLIGILAAVYRHRWLDTGAMTLAFIGISTPSFVLGLLFLDLLAFRLGWFPVGGYGIGLWGHIQHALLPALVLSILGAATYARLMRSELIETLSSDFVRTARAKGVSGFRATMVHAFRNALAPIVTVIGMSFAMLVSGAIVTEAVFAWPGVGRLAVESINTRDAPALMGVVLVVSVAVQVGNLLADIAVAALDPRVRIER